MKNVFVIISNLAIWHEKMFVFSGLFSLCNQSGIMRKDV